ncbi:MAG: glycosyltransferase [Nitrospira sp.]
MRIGIFDHMSPKLGGGQLVAAQMAAQLSREHAVELIHSGEGYSLARLAQAFALDLSRVSERVVSGSHGSFNVPGRHSVTQFLLKGLRSDRELTGPYDLFVYSGHGVPPVSAARQGLIYCHFPCEGCPEETVKSIDQFKQKTALGQWIRLAVYNQIWDLRMRGYEMILANSSFTAHWIRQVWRKSAEVVYPPVALTVPSIEKRNVIVSIGRFIDSRNNKNHHEQLRSLREFLQSGAHGWSLRLIGFCSMMPREKAYLEELRQLAEGLPVEFIVNAERSVVVRHLAEAKLFWHTAGIGEGGEQAPAQMEHFGIATVEAMLAGCVPLAPAYGGQVEIVEHGRSGFLCRSISELVKFSNQLAGDSQLLDSMGRQAVARGHLFSQAAFEQRISQVVSRYRSGFEPS